MLKKLILVAAVAATCTATANVVTLDWPLVTDATSYRVYSRPNFPGGQVFTLIATVTTNTWSSTNITTTGRWDYHVKSVNLAGESSASTQVTSPPVAAAPQTTVLTMVDNTANLAWQAVPDASSYNVYTRVWGSGNPFTLAASGIVALNWSTNLTPFGRWEFYLKSVNLAGESSGLGNVVSTPAIPPAPATLTSSVSP